MIKITYKIFGQMGELTETVSLNTTRDMQLLLQSHVTSSKAYLWVPDAGFKIHIVADGLIPPYVYNNSESIMELCNNPDLVFRKSTEFPVELSEELLAELKAMEAIDEG